MRLRTMILCLATLAFLAGPALAADPLSARERAWLTKHGPLKIGAFQAYAPVCFVDGEGKLVGMGVDLWKKVGETLGVEIQFSVTPFQEQLDGLSSGRFDSLIGIFPLPSRAARYDFCKPYTVINTNIWVNPRYSNVQGMAGLAGLKVGVVTGDSGQNLCQDAKLDCRGFVNYLATVRALADGKVDALILDDLVVAYWVHKLGLESRMTKIEEPVQTFDMVFPVKKGNAMLVGILNKVVVPLRDEAWPLIVVDWMQQ